MTIKKGVPFILLILLCRGHLYAQAPEDPLFSEQTPLDMSLKISISSIRDAKKDSVYLTHTLYYRASAGSYDSLHVDLKGRGNFRYRECYFPPLWIRIKSKDAKGTVFEGNKKLKLVLPCYTRESGNILILKEFLCYKLYQEITPYSFRTRLVNIDLTEERGKKDKSFKIKGILIEDMNKIASRLQARPLPNVRINPAVLNDTLTMRFELFQFMISNTDWSAVFQHNAKLIVQGSDKYVSLIYDFDMSGLVNAPYSIVPEINGEKLNINHVTERYYRGYCHSPGVMEFVRREFISKEEKLMAVPDQLKGELSEKEIKGIKEYLKEFFIILKNDRYFKINILDRCRPK
ncbi:MAG TPA: hypothetical protein VFI33_16315 [Puia sp.]|nr:hypothetical protein [Puia sp.]